jgi:hypothetical protein
VYRSRANRLASSPPSAPRISTITLRPGVRIRRYQQPLQLVLDQLQRGARRDELRLERGTLGLGGDRQQLAGGLAVGEDAPPAPSRVDEGPELVVAGGDSTQLGRIGQHPRVGETSLEVGVLLLQRGQPLDDRRGVPWGGNGIGHGSTGRGTQ